MATDWSKLYKTYKGRWVALLDDEETVVGAGTTAKAALAVATKRGYQSPILSRVPDTLSAFVG
jgi:hypothetical protein